MGRSRLLPRASCLLSFGNPSILWSPTVHGAAIRTLRKRNSIRQLIDLRQFDIDVRGDQSFCIRTFEHQMRQRSLQLSPANKARLSDSGQAAKLLIKGLEANTLE